MARDANLKHEALRLFRLTLKHPEISQHVAAMTEKKILGSCACGNITYTSTAEPEHLDYCYCLTCQQVSGAPFMAWMGVPKESLHWEFKTEPIIYRQPIGDTGAIVSERTNCDTCGCNIMLQYYFYPEKSHVAASTIIHNDFEMPKVGCHIWFRHVPAWHTVGDDGVQRTHEFGDDFNVRVEQYINSQKT